MKEGDKRKSHISSKLHVTYISSNNVRNPVTKTFTTLHLTILHSTSQHLSLHFLSFKLHPATLHYPLIWLKSIQISYRSISTHITTLHLTSLHCTFRWLSLQRLITDWTQSSSLESSQIESWPGTFLDRRSAHSSDSNDSTLKISWNTYKGVLPHRFL